MKDNTYDKVAKAISEIVGGCFVPNRNCWQKDIPLSKASVQLPKGMIQTINKSNAREREWLREKAKEIIQKVTGGD